MWTMAELEVDIFGGTAGPCGLPIFWMLRGETTTVDAEKIHASLKDGVLELRLPKSEAAKPKRIAIREAQKAAIGR